MKEQMSKGMDSITEAYLVFFPVKDNENPIEAENSQASQKPTPSQQTPKSPNRLSFFKK